MTTIFTVNTFTKRPHVRKPVATDDYDKSLFFCKLLAVFPYNISNNMVTYNILCIALTIAFYIILISLEIYYIASHLTESITYHLIIHTMEFGLTVASIMGLMVSLFSSKYRQIIKIMIGIQSNLVVLNENLTAAKFKFSTSKKLFHGLPILVIIICDLQENFETFDRALTVALYYQTIRELVFVLSYAILIGWVEHVFSRLIAVLKQSKNVDNVEILWTVEDAVRLMVDRLNGVYSPALFTVVVQSFIVISNNAFWAISSTEWRARVTHGAWMLMYMSILKLGFGSAEACKRQVSRI